MTTYQRVCLEDQVIEDVEGHVARIVRGREYITSREYPDGTVTVYSGQYWGRFPVTAFAGPRLFTGPAEEPAPHNWEVA